MFLLVIVKGVNAGSVFPLNIGGPVIMGRGAECHIKIGDPKVSRRHCCIEEKSGAYYLKDMGSTNKTRLNGRIIDRQTRLASGDIIGTGDTLIIFTNNREEAVRSVEEYRQMRLRQTMQIDAPQKDVRQ